MTDLDPLKLHEYLASGQPTIGTHIRSLEEFANVLILVKASSQWSSAIAEALSPLATDPKRRVARQQVAELHDWKHLVANIANTIVQRLEEEGKVGQGRFKSEQVQLE